MKKMLSNTKLLDRLHSDVHEELSGCSRILECFKCLEYEVVNWRRMDSGHFV